MITTPIDFERQVSVFAGLQFETLDAEIIGLVGGDTPCARRETLETEITTRIAANNTLGILSCSIT